MIGSRGCLPRRLRWPLRQTDSGVLASFAAWFVVLIVAHWLADHLKPDEVSKRKAAPTPEQIARGVWRHRGWGAAAVHVAQYHAVMLLVCGAARGGCCRCTAHPPPLSGRSGSRRRPMR